MTLSFLLKLSNRADSNPSQGETKLCRFRYEAVKDLVRKPGNVLIFLGVEKSNKPSSSPQRGEEAQEPPAWFAINTDEDVAELLKRCRENNCFFPKMPNRDLLKLNEDEAGEEDTVFLFFFRFNSIKYSKIH